MWLIVIIIIYCDVAAQTPKAAGLANIITHKQLATNNVKHTKK